MIDHKTYMRASTIIFAAVAILHAVRIFNNWKMVVGPYMIPVALSWVALIIAGGLAYTGYKHLR